MYYPPGRTAHHFWIAFTLWLLATGPLAAAPTGPTLKFDYGAGDSAGNPLSHFMYFVPLVSPDHVCLFTNVGNTQRAHVISCHCRTNGADFHAVCEFSFIGNGIERNTFDHAFILHRRQKELHEGKAILHQLTSINVEGAGAGTIEIDGRLTNGQPAVTTMSLRFNSHGHTSPVTVDLQDIVLRDGVLHYENETVARVNTLTFRQGNPPKMEVSLASVKRKDAGDGVWQNLVGEIKGAAANLLLPPLTITTNGNETMMNFGQALATRKPTFTFPFATRLTNSLPATL